MTVESHALLAAFSPDAQRRLIALAEHERHEGRFCLFRENDPSDAVYLVLDGEVELTKEVSADRQVVIARVGAGDYFGDMGPIDGCGRSTGATAVGPVRLARIPSAPLLEILRQEEAAVSLQFFGRLSERLRRANELFVAEVLRKEKLHFVGEMARSIIHDFKGQMAGIECVTSLMRSENPDEKVSRCCELIGQQVSRMSAMAEELLDYSQGRCQLFPVAITLDELFEALAFTNADCLRVRRVELRFAGGETRARLDKNRILRVLQNLLTNAVEALAPGGGHVRLEATPWAGGGVELRVTDDGPGIPEAIRETLFEPFVTAGKKHGLGLGMAIVRSIVEAHGGTIGFHTGNGQGTTFVLHLPPL